MKILASKLGLLAAAGLMAATFTATAHAQDVNLLRVHIPFSFLAGDQNMAPGDYTVKLDPRFNLVDILPMDSAAIHRVRLQQGFVRRPRHSSDKAMLTFAKYGDQMVLRDIFAYGKLEGHAVKVSKAEKEMASTTGGAPADIETVMVR